MKASLGNRRRIILSLVGILLIVLACNIPTGEPANNDAQLQEDTPPTTLQPADNQPTQTTIPEISDEQADAEFSTLPVTTVPLLAILTGEPQQLLSQDIGPEGGTLTISAPGNPLDGFTLVVPAGAYAENVHFDISAAPIGSTTLPAGLTPVTSMIQVDNGGVAASESLKVTVPVTLTDDEFAMLFTYDGSTGALDGLPVLEEDNTHIIGLTMHFSDILGVKVNKAELDALKIQTGFRQGVNNWQFTNYGAYPEPGGICLGMSLTAMDYFLRKGGIPLYGVYDNYGNTFVQTPNLQDDDRLAYRLATVAQMSLDWDTFYLRYWWEAQDAHDDYFTYYSLALALRAHAEPQLVDIRSSTGGGHAMIVYGKYADRFYISDPNYPSPDAKRAIIFDRSSGMFRPYYSGPSADDLGKAYWTFHYLNKYAMFSEAKLASLWSAFDAGTIGEAEFPEYTLSYYTSGEPDEIGTTMFDFNTYVPGSTFAVKVNSGADAGLTVYDRNSSKVDENLVDGMVMVSLTDVESTPFLFVISGRVGGKMRWIDGRWFNFIQSFEGTWRGAACGAGEDPPFRWQVSLSQNMDGSVTGDVYFHKCPGGGQAFYRLSGKHVIGEAFVKLEGVKTGGRGPLGESSASQVDFIFNRDGTISPNFAP
jgi:hypothetical protein